MTLGNGYTEQDAGSDGTIRVSSVDAIQHADRPDSPPLDPVSQTGAMSTSDEVARFWSCGPVLDDVEIKIELPDHPPELLSKLGSSPFERGGFPLLGFLDSVYNRVAQHAVDRA